MANNKNLHKANKAKNDEFYTQYKDIELEIEAYNKENFTGKTVYCCCDDVFTSNFAKYFLNNFKRLKLKELIVSGFSTTEKGTAYYFRTTDPAKYIEDGNFKTELIKTEVKEMKRDGIYVGGDFRSAMATELLKQSDIVITNPPFSLFREFIAWIIEADKKFIIIGNQNAITYKEVFPLIMENKMWLGNGFSHGNAFFAIAENAVHSYSNSVYNKDTQLVKFRNCCWFTNVDHGKRHQKLSLMTMEENLKYSKHKSLREQGYLKYDNYDAIEVPYTDAIPSDYEPCWFKCPQAKECTYAQTEGFTDEALCEKKNQSANNLRSNCHQKENVTELWECQSHFLINSALNSSELLERQTTVQTTNSIYSNLYSINDMYLNEFSYKKCNGIMGVPVTFLNKYNPDQFEIIGFFNNYKPETADTSKGQIYGKAVKVTSTKSLFRGPVINGNAKYFRILIKQKKQVI